MIEEAKVYSFIETLSPMGMAIFRRFAEPGHPLFDRHLPFYKHFEERFEIFGGMTPELSIEIGWDSKLVPKKDILLEYSEDGHEGLWLNWIDYELQWYIVRWLTGRIAQVSDRSFNTATEGIKAWILGEYELLDANGTHKDDLKGQLEHSKSILGSETQEIKHA